LESQSAYSYASESIILYQELDRITSDYVLQKVALKSDGLQVKAKLANAEFEAMTANDDLATRKEQLNFLMGRDVRTEFEVNAIPEETPFEHDIMLAQKQALESNPQIRKAQLQLKEAGYDKRIKKAEYIPDVSLSLNYIAPLHYDFVPSVIASYGIYFSWDIYDWGRKSHELAQKERTVRQSELALLELQNKVLVDVNSQFRKVQESRKLVSVSRLAMDAARENERIITDKYKERSALLKDVAQAHTSLEESRDQSQKALLAFWAARADLEQTLGEDP
jgi:outer membrane protein TolC